MTQRVKVEFILNSEPGFEPLDSFMSFIGSKMNQNFIEQKNEKDLRALGLPLGSQEACRPKIIGGAKEREQESRV